MSTEPAAEGQLIVVGVSKSGSRAALLWAEHHAHRIGGRVRAVLAWRPPRPPAAPGGHPPVVPRTGADDPAAEAQARLARMVAETLGEDHQVECVAVRGGPVGALLTAAADASLLVLDSPRPTKLAKMSSTLVASRLIYRAPCPVVVIPPPPGTADRAIRRSAGRLATALAQAAGTAGRPGLPPPVPPPPPTTEQH